MPCVIVIGGAPGCGKSTLAAALRQRLRCPWIDFGRLREFHLLPDWSDQNPQEEAMAFENLISIARNYLRHGYEHVIIDDLRHPRVLAFPAAMPDAPVRILTLICSDPVELRRRLVERNDGFKDPNAALRWNQQIMESIAAPKETRIDVAGKPRGEVLDAALIQLGISG